MKYILVSIISILSVSMFNLDKIASSNIKYTINDAKKIYELNESFAQNAKGKNPYKIEGYDFSDFLCIEMNLSSLNPGTYTIDGKNTFYFAQTVSKQYDGSDGQIIITENKNGKVSGTFIVKLVPQDGTTDKSINQISGSFDKINLK